MFGQIFFFSVPWVHQAAELLAVTPTAKQIIPGQSAAPGPSLARILEYNPTSLKGLQIGLIMPGFQGLQMEPLNKRFKKQEKLGS